MSSRLLHNEEGRVGLHDFRAQTVASQFDLPSLPTRAELFVLAQRAAPETSALRVCIGAQEYSLGAPNADGMHWLRAVIDAKDLSAGENTIKIPAQCGWKVAHEAEVSVIRLRVDDAKNDAEIFPRYGDAAIEGENEKWLSLLPAKLQQAKNRWDWCWGLAGYLAAAWEYSDEDEGVVYAPWDARKILQWGRAGRDDNGEKPIAMCVHYAVAFVQFCIAMGIPARAVVLSPDLNSPNGHFVAEVWLEEFGSWAMIDPNLHLCFRDASTQRPLSAAELFARRAELRALAQFSEGWDAQKNRLQNFAQQQCLSGDVYRLWGVWARHDWIENPHFAPLAHGAIPYCETDILWCAPDPQTRNELAMFPQLLTAQQLTIKPVQ